MTNLNFLLIVTFSSISVTVQGQSQCKCKDVISIKYEDISSIDPPFYAPDTIRFDNYSYIEKFYIKNCFGSMVYEKFDSTSKLIEKGELFGEKKPVRSIVNTYDLYGNQTGKTKIKMHHPIKIGWWNYFDNSGKLIREEYFELGKLKETKTY